MASTAPQGSRPTLESVASRAAVSRQTVSNVLNAPHLVRPDTIDRVRAAIDDLGYRPHRAAQALRTRRSRLIGLRLEPIRDGINGAVLDRFLHALTEEAQTANYRIELFVAAGRRRRDHAVRPDAGRGRRRCVRDHGDAPRRSSDDLAGRTRRAVRDVRAPVGRAGCEPATIHGSTSTVQQAPGRRPSTCLPPGTPAIAFLGWPTGSGVGDDRRSGWSAAMIDAGTSPDALVDLDHAGTDDVAAGLAATTRLLARAGSADRRRLLQRLARSRRDDRGHRGSGAELEVIGFDDTPVATALGLSSVAQPVAEAARHALGLLVHQMDQTAATRSAPPDPHRLLAPHLVLRTPTFTTR